jgi:hypothetical protein
MVRAIDEAALKIFECARCVEYAKSCPYTFAGLDGYPENRIHPDAYSAAIDLLATMHAHHTDNDLDGPLDPGD